MSSPYPSPVFPTFGILGTPVPRADRLDLSGWVIAPGRDPVDGMRVFIGEREVVAAVSTGLESEDVRKVHPQLPGAGNARFRIVVEGSAARFPVENELVAVVPTSGGRPGAPITVLVAPQVQLPSEEVLQITGGSFKAAYEFFAYFVSYCSLRPEHAVLEVGCGCGRMAYPLAYHLKPPGRYEGFDIVERLITSATAALTPTFPNVRFQQVDVFNSVYNPRGRVKSVELVFPYEDQSFDLVFLTSVFTHMFPEDVRHYLGEIQRVLRPGGNVLMTCFLLTPESEALIAAGRSSQNLMHELGECRIAKREAPEAAVGFTKERFLGWIEAAGLSVTDIAPGFWCGRVREASYQDLVVATRARS